MLQDAVLLFFAFLSVFVLLFVNGRLLKSNMTVSSFASRISPIVIPTSHPVIPTEEATPFPTLQNTTRSVPPFSVIIVTHNEKLLMKTL